MVSVPITNADSTNYVVDHNNSAPIGNSEVIGYYGVVEIVTNDGQTVGSGVMIAPGTVLTAAHLWSTSTLDSTIVANYEVRFTYPDDPTNPTSLTTKTRDIRDVIRHASFSAGTFANDIALLQLEGVAPVQAERYDLYTGRDEAGQEMQIVGYGVPATGFVGETARNNWPALRTGFNRVDFTGQAGIGTINASASGSQLFYDFDNGTSTNDAFGRLGYATDVGLGLREVNSTRGDSGGGNFINGQVAGITSFGADIVSPADVDYVDDDYAASFGDISGITRVSSYVDWIETNVANLNYGATSGSFTFSSDRQFDAGTFLSNIIAKTSTSYTINFGSISHTGSDSAGRVSGEANFGTVGTIRNGFFLSTGWSTAAADRDNGGAGEARLTAAAQAAFGAGATTSNASMYEFSIVVGDSTIQSLTLEIVFSTNDYLSGASFNDVAVVMVNGVNYALFDNDASRTLSAAAGNLTAGGFQSDAAAGSSLSFAGLSAHLRISAPLVQGTNTIAIGIADVGGAAVDDSAIYVANMQVSDAKLTGLRQLTQGTSAANTLTATGAEGRFLEGLGGNDILVSNAGNDLLSGGDGNDALTGGAGNDQLDGGAGTDSASYRAAASGVNVNLQTGTATGGAGIDTLNSIESVLGSDHGDNLVGNTTVGTTLSGYAGNDYLQGGSGIDWLQGGDDHDVLIGGAGNDILQGGAGSEWIDGGAGADNIDGGDDVDNVFYTNSSAGVTVNLATGTGSGGDAHGDLLTNVESVYGSNHNDWLISGTGDDRLWGQGGADNIDGGSGNDFIRGHSGADDLDGGADHDILYADEGNDTLFGGTGSDWLDGGTGADDLDGGDGIDNVTYSASTSGVTINLVTNTVTGGEATGDILANLESFYGSHHDDTLISSTNGDRLWGQGGNDILRGNGGNDWIVGGAGIDDIEGGADHDNLWGDAGADRIIGGTGNDWLNGGADGDTIDGGDGIDNLTYSNSSAGITLDLNTTNGTGGDAEGDTVTNVESVYGSNFDDTLTSTNLGSRLWGQGGNDNLTTGSGNDWLGGGTGNDTLAGGGGNDSYVFARGDGQDTLSSVGSDGSAGNMYFGASVDYDQLWFERSGDDLVVSIVGTTDNVTFTDFYTSTREVSHLRAGGHTLDIQASSSAVDNLVSAMAAFSPPGIGVLDLPVAVRSDTDVSNALAAWTV